MSWKFWRTEFRDKVMQKLTHEMLVVLQKKLDYEVGLSPYTKPIVIQFTAAEFGWICAYLQNRFEVKNPDVRKDTDSIEYKGGERSVPCSRTGGIIFTDIL
jgi:hypothetical protein